MELLGSIVISAIISSIISVIISNKKNKLKYITNERQKWRKDIRQLSARIFKLLNENKSLTNEQQNKLDNLKFKLRLRLNPTDDYDEKIVNIIEKLKSDFSDEQMDDFKEMVSRLLKHDWERSKLETKVWFIRFFKKSDLEEIREITE